MASVFVFRFRVNNLVLKIEFQVFIISSIFLTLCNQSVDVIIF